MHPFNAKTKTSYLNHVTPITNFFSFFTCTYRLCITDIYKMENRDLKNTIHEL